MPAAEEEIEQAEEEGISVRILEAPVEILAQNGRTSAVKCVKMELGEPDESGRRRPLPVSGSEFDIEIDNVIIAIGQKVDKAALPGGLDYTDWGTLSIDPVSRQTNIENVFAGGDVVRGPADVIKAVSDGKEAAVSIDRYLSGVDLKEGRPEVFGRVENVPKEGVEKQPRAEMPLLAPKQRKAFEEVELGFDEESAVREAKRCLNCSVCSECMECVKSCETGAINHNMQDEVVEVDAGSIILATGFKSFNPSGIYQYGYGRLENVITGLELERLVNSAGPTDGHIKLKNGDTPQRVGIIHCIGSRDKKYHEYCSRVCCMYSMKLAHLIREHLPECEVYEFYTDIRSFGKGFEEFYNRVLGEKVNFIRGIPGEVSDIAESADEKGRLVVQFEDTLAGVRQRMPMDMVVLSCALEPQPGRRRRRPHVQYQP